jgi:hypothetical protein
MVTGAAVTAAAMLYSLWLYFLPYRTARIVNHPNQIAIGALNLLVGWTVLGWIAALAWSCTPDSPHKPAAVIQTSKMQPAMIGRGNFVGARVLAFPRTRNRDGLWVGAEEAQ